MSIAENRPAARAATPAPAPTIEPRSLTIGDPGPLGLACFACTTFVLSVFNAGLVVKEAEPVVLGLALFYGGAVQVLAGLMEYFKANTFGATAFCSYGAFWMSLWYLVTHAEMLAPAGEDAGKGIGVYLLGWAIFTAYMLITVTRVNLALTATFSFLLAAFLLLAAGDMFADATATQWGGYIGIVTAFLAWYCSFAGVMNNTAGKPVIPVWPRH